MYGNIRQGVFHFYFNPIFPGSTLFYVKMFLFFFLLYVNINNLKSIFLSIIGVEERSACQNGNWSLIERVVLLERVGFKIATLELATACELKFQSIKCHVPRKNSNHFWLIDKLMPVVEVIYRPLVHQSNC